MNVLFMGTPEFALPSLEQIWKSQHTVVAVVTALDKPRGRGHRVQPTPVAASAERLGIPVMKVSTLKGVDVLAQIQAIEFDAVALVAFGQIIPASLLNETPLGCINLHPSLLPRYRGASPIHAPLLAGDTMTGVTTMYMDEGLDTGNLILQEEVPIPAGANAGDLHDVLAERGARLLVRTLDDVEAGRARRTPQDEGLASYAPKVTKEEIDWTLPGQEIVRLILGLSPYPGVHTTWNGRRVKTLRARHMDGAPGLEDAEPGTLLSLHEDGVGISTGNGLVVITELQVSGRSVVSGAEFIRGFHPKVGERLA